MKKLFKNTSAWLPIVMSGAALAFTLTYLAIFGNVHHEDEGLAAHIFQLLMGSQILVIGYFVIKWFPKNPKEALKILLLQGLAIILAFAPVYILEL